MARYRVDPGAPDRRLDQLVADRAGLSVAAARRLIAAGAVRVDGRPARKGQHPTAGQTVEVEDAGVAAQGPDGWRVRADPDLAITVLRVEGGFVAIDKPAGVPAHPQAAGQLGTAANAIVAKFPECAGASPDPREGGLVHRLDTGTSGVLLAARSAAAWTALRAALSGPECEKSYLAEVVGSSAESGQTSAPIGRVGRRGARVRVDGGRQPLPAQTSWEVIGRRPETTLLRVRLRRGRAHQVRAHLSASGHPIVGDALYGTEAGTHPDAGLHLHAASVQFRDPVSGELILIESPPPPWA
ncbi:MAG TPA: RluA family pseudouridine synthase [Polyangia bacterium]|nr:RluA family pseudouridine synthase [Polyangia bacterium]